MKSSFPVVINWLCKLQSNPFFLSFLGKSPKSDHQLSLSTQTNSLDLQTHPPTPPSETTKIPFFPFRGRWSDPLHLVGLDDGVGSGDGVAAGGLEIEGAAVLFRVAVRRAKGAPAAALESRQPHPPLAVHAPVLPTRCRILLLLRPINWSIRGRRWRWGWKGKWDNGSAPWRRRRVEVVRIGGGWFERFVDSNFGRGRLLLFDTPVPVTLGAEVPVRRRAEEPTPVCAETVVVLRLVPCSFLHSVIRCHLCCFLSSLSLFLSLDDDDDDWWNWEIL